MGRLLDCLVCGDLLMDETLKGAFDSFQHEHLPRTKYDIIVDESSNKPGEQAFEVEFASRTWRPLLTCSWGMILETDLREIPWRNLASRNLRAH